MKTINFLAVRPVFVISTLLIALSLPTLALAVHYQEAGSFMQGAKTWANNCSRCHNIRDPQDLRDDQWISSMFHMRIRAGLTGQQTRDILTFLQESNKQFTAEPTVLAETATSSGSVFSGSDIYNQTCIACHGANGKGTVPGAPDFTKPAGSLSQSDEVLMQRINQGFQSPGSPMAMPPKGGNTNLTTTDIQAVLGYIRENFGN